MKRTTQLKLEGLLRKLIRENRSEQWQPGNVVTVTGDRNLGKYRVELLKRYSGPDQVEDDEIIFSAKVIDVIKDSYKNIRPGTVCYVVYNPGSNLADAKNTSGYIDPEIR